MTAEPPGETEEPGPERSAARGWIITIAAVVGFLILLRLIVFQVYSIPSPSMASTLEVGDRVVVQHLFTEPERGDIVVFDRPSTDPKTSPSDPDVLIKRVIGLPGETVESREGKVFVDGKRLDEDYLDDDTETIITKPIEVPDGQMLVLGDNRGQSFDGRFFGPIDQDLVVGIAVGRVWPISRIGGI